MEAIILAGGLGTRLQGVIGAKPKCMAPIAGTPFLHYLLTYLELQQVKRVVLALGYLHQEVKQYLENNSYNLNFHFVIESKALGTGGAIVNALKHCTSPNVIICNGDTLFLTSLNSFYKKHFEANTICTIALKPMKHFERYGTVHFDERQQVSRFEEKKAQQEGYINAGLYVINKEQFLLKPFVDSFSFEKDYLEQYYKQEKIAVYVSDAYFLDIGIPEDYQKAQTEIVQQFEKLEK